MLDPTNSNEQLQSPNPGLIHVCSVSRSTISSRRSIYLSFSLPFLTCFAYFLESVIRVIGKSSRQFELVLLVFIERDFFGESIVINLVSLLQFWNLLRHCSCFVKAKKNQIHNPETFTESYYRFSLDVICFRKEFRLCLAFIAYMVVVSQSGLPRL
jgi:hypothetical protein